MRRPVREQVRPDQREVVQHRDDEEHRLLDQDAGPVVGEGPVVERREVRPDQHAGEQQPREDRVGHRPGPRARAAPGRSRRRLRGPLARKARVMGAPRTRRGAAAMVTTRCWVMWTQKKVCDHAAIGPRYISGQKDYSRQERRGVAPVPPSPRVRRVDPPDGPQVPGRSEQEVGRHEEVDPPGAEERGHVPPPSLATVWILPRVPAQHGPRVRYFAPIGVCRWSVGTPGGVRMKRAMLAIVTVLIGVLVVAGSVWALSARSGGAGVPRGDRGRDGTDTAGGAAARDPGAVDLPEHLRRVPGSASVPSTSSSRTTRSSRRRAGRSTGRPRR